MPQSQTRHRGDHTEDHAPDQTRFVNHTMRGPSRRRSAAGVTAALLLASLATAGDGPLPATDADFFQGGTQPDVAPFDSLNQSTQCAFCHANYAQPEVEPYAPWTASMLGQSSRDPLFWAELAIANQDVAGAGQFCIRCHVPMAFLRGHDAPDGSEITPDDRDGVSCIICHRMVDPIYEDGVSPIQDDAILTDLANAGLIPAQGSNARYIIDPTDTRRGPYDDVPLNPHIGQPEIIHSPFHLESDLCWTCHDVSNPLTVKTKEGSYVYAIDDAPHPSGDQEEMLPLHRTFSEWKNSYYFTQGGVDHEGRFGGNHPTGIMVSCQDCHMPDQEGKGCGLPAPFFERPDIGQHSFSGSNNWVLRAIRDLEDDFTTGLSEAKVNDAIARNESMLERASDLELTQTTGVLNARVINRTGHKLPTGFPDGRRIWLNVRFLDEGGATVEERGAYDFATGTLMDEGADTTVFEIRLGLDAYAAGETGHPEGDTFHFALANTILKDNRIPPIGFVNSVALESNSQPIGETYNNGQHWHTTEYAIPAGSTQAVVTVYYQVTSKEFIEFLRDENSTNDAGQVAYDQWLLHGMSPPVVMDTAVLDLFNPADIDQDGVVGFSDLLLILTWWGECLPEPFECPFDLNGDGFVNFEDLLVVLAAWGQEA